MEESLIFQVLHRLFQVGTLMVPLGVAALILTFFNNLRKR